MRAGEHTYKILLTLFLAGICFIPEAEAHVKWFTDGSYADRPLRLSEVTEGRFFYGLLALCLLVVILGVWLDSRISKSIWYIKIDTWLETRKSFAPIVLRVAAAMVLILSWQSNAMIVPTIPIPKEYAWLGWFQFVLAFCLLIPKLVPIGGLGIVVIWIMGNITLHPFHMLDYLMIAGCGIYLIFSSLRNAKYHDLGVVILYATVGFSLCWVALEKFIYPNWALFLIKEHPKIAMGFNFNFFLESIGFVEFGLGFLLLICFLQRPLAITITIVFFITSSIFGKVEIIGHTMIHGALIVFLLEGPGKYYIKLREKFKNVFRRMAFAAVTFVALFACMVMGYSELANNKYEKKLEFLAKKPNNQGGQLELAGYPKSELPSIWMEIKKDAVSGYNIQFNTIKFNFTPDKINTEHVMGEGFVNLYVNGEKVSRVYCDKFHLDLKEPGTYEIVATLNTNMQSEYCVRGTPISAKENIIIDDN